MLSQKDYLFLDKHNTQSCTEHTTTYWEDENQYKQAPGEYLGIWNNIVNDAKLHNTYGFTMLYVSNNSDIDSAYSAGFKYDSLMLRLSSYNTAFSTIDAANSGGRHVGSYFIDEPIESGTWYDALIEDVASYVYPKSLLLAAMVGLHGIIVIL